MGDTGAKLPDDPALLKELVSELRQQLEVERRLSQQLRNQVEQLARKLFGRKSEKLNPDQLSLVFEELHRLGFSEEPEEESEAPAGCTCR